MSVNLGSGSQMMTYDQMQQAFMKNFATVDPLSGKVQTTITIVDRTSGGVQASTLDSGAYEQSAR